MFPWCGILIDMDFLDVLVDSSRLEETGSLQLKSPKKLALRRREQNSRKDSIYENFAVIKE